jgi:hypothetical protein
MHEEFISNQQKSIVLSPDKYKLVNGCAGSRKTDTLIKCAVFDLQTNRRPILFLTLVGSVTNEIKNRLETRLCIDIEKQGGSNHYVGYYNDVPICISNFDAWVHLMLQDVENIDDIADCFSEKVELLCEKTETERLKCHMKNNIAVGCLFIDEVQDLCPSKMKIITNISKTHHDLSICCAGDYLQTIFDHEVDNAEFSDTHSMNIFKRINPTYFDLNICKRCPKAHVDFNNLLLEDIQSKYIIPQMCSDNNNHIDKPVLFTHYKTSDNTNAIITAEQVTVMIEILMNQDPTIVPDDIVVIMRKSNDQGIYYQLQFTLQKLYDKLGYSDSVLYMKTKADGFHNALDWKKAKGRTKLLSVCGDKGCGHRVVFLLGLTENSIPSDAHICTSSEIISESLLNVGLTRSTQYLFIGFTYNYPSRYLKRKHETLDKFTYSAWNYSDDIPEPYRSVVLSQTQNPLPVWTSTYRNEQKMSGKKSVFEVRDDISKDFNQTKNLVMRDWKKDACVQNFGQIQKINTKLQDDHCVIMGVMSELLVRRIWEKNVLFEFLSNANNSKNTMYTTDEHFLSCMYDIKKIGFNSRTYYKEYYMYFLKKPELVKKINFVIFSKQNVVHSIFKSAKFQKDLTEFMSPVPNRELRTESIWNVTVFYIQLTQRMYRPCIKSCLGFLTEDIDTLHENIETYVTKYISGSEIVFEKNVSIIGALSDDDMVALKKRPSDNSNKVGIAGRIDIYDESKRNIYELKASSLAKLSQEWLTQTVMYASMLDVYNSSAQHIYVVNILKGVMWSWDVSSLPKLEHVVSTKIRKKYNLHNLEIDALVKTIENHRRTF